MEFKRILLLLKQRLYIYPVFIPSIMSMTVRKVSQVQRQKLKLRLKIGQIS